MINNVRIRIRRKKLKLYHLDIEIEPGYLTTLFITAYKDTYHNYTVGKFKFVHYYMFLLILICFSIDILIVVFFVVC